MKILIMGAAGCGTTTFGKMLANHLNYEQVESDFYSWEQTDPPFQHCRPELNSYELLKQDLERNENLIISGSIARFCRNLSFNLNLVVFLTAPLEVRLERLNKRGHKLFNDRIDVGHDMFETHQELINYAKQYDNGGLNFRSLKLHEGFMENQIKCPVIRINTNKPKEEVFNELMEKINEYIMNI